MLTQAMVKDGILRQGLGTTNEARAQNAVNLAANAKKMRQANFGLGSHLPENNKYSLQNLTEGQASPNNGRPTNFHLTAQSLLKQNPTPSQPVMSPPRVSGGVSQGMIGRGLPNATGVQHLTTNQSYIKWI
jgi:hypothetical protein